MLDALVRDFFLLDNVSGYDILTMMKLINIDTMTGREISNDQAAKLETAMAEGRISAEWEESQDCTGDVCLESEAYSQAVAVL